MFGLRPRMLRELIGCLAAAGMLITLDPAIAAQSVGGLGGIASASRVAATGLAAPVVTSYTVIATYAGSDTETWKGDAHTGNGTGSTEFSFNESEKVTVNLYATKPQEVYSSVAELSVYNGQREVRTDLPGPQSSFVLRRNLYNLAQAGKPLRLGRPSRPDGVIKWLRVSGGQGARRTGRLFLLGRRQGRAPRALSSNGGNSGVDGRG